MTYPARTQRAMALRRERPFQQFGQSGDLYTVNGATGCTHTVLQFLTLLWKGRFYSHDDISRIAGYPNQSNVDDKFQRGLRPSEVQHYCDKIGLPYAVKYDLTAFDILKATARGPVGFGHSYSWWPEWQGFHYGGKVADGSPNGFGRPLRHAGRTQLTGFVPPRDAHFGLVLGWDQGAAGTSARVVAWEPNHGSGARPEKPPYDLITSAQFRGVYESYHRVLARRPYALIPRRSLPL